MSFEIFHDAAVSSQSGKGMKSCGFSSGRTPTMRNCSEVFEARDDGGLCAISASARAAQAVRGSLPGSPFQPLSLVALREGGHIGPPLHGRSFGSLAVERFEVMPPASGGGLITSRPGELGEGPDPPGEAQARSGS